MKKLISATISLLTAFILMSPMATAQQYTGLTGLIHTPDAEMDSAGTARIGMHILNKEFTPKQAFDYTTGDAYLSLTPFSWMEIGYTMTLFRRGDAKNKKDRYFSIKFRPLKEGKWWPAIAVGANDFISSGIWKSLDPGEDNLSNGFFRNYYISATKHFDLKGHELGATLSYRYFTNGRNLNHYNGVVGGITYRPRFFRPLRAILEYAGRDVNFGVDCLLWKHLLLQASLQRFKYPSGGVCYVVNLF